MFSAGLVCAGLRHGRAAEIIRYVRTHAMEDCTLSETAGALYVTPNYISKLFRKVMDTTFTDYVSAIRAEEAKRQLRTTSKNRDADRTGLRF